jgi:RNA polymerase sigma-70 factor (ECF subfamily)
MSDRPLLENHEFQSYRDYLLMIARAQLPRDLWVKQDPSDLVQNTLLDAFQQQHTYRGNSRNEMLAWLRQILHNKVADAIRYAHREKRDVKREQSMEQSVRESSLRLEGFLVASDLPPDRVAEQIEAHLQLANSLARLPDDMRLVIELRYFAGQSVQDIAAQLNRTQKSIAGLLYRGLLRLRQGLSRGECGQ